MLLKEEKRSCWRKAVQEQAKARSLGRKVSNALFYLNANKINAELNPNELRIPKSAAMRFISTTTWKGLALQHERVQRKKQVQTGRFEE